ncbi:MAG: hypothetical protein M3Q83_03390 [Pseudomonadota bacterium]|nr:hypothetical protein [Pseudomonadota bacterium]
MRVTTIFALLVGSLAPVGALAETTPVSLAPSSQWQVEFADSVCVLSRQYVRDGATRVLFLKPELNSDSFELSIGTVTRQASEPSAGRAALTIAGKPKVGSLEYTAYNNAAMRLVRIPVDGSKMPLSGLRKTIAIDAEEEGRFVLGIGGIERALPSLARCVAELRHG